MMEIFLPFVASSMAALYPAQAAQLEAGALLDVRKIGLTLKPLIATPTASAAGALVPPTTSSSSSSSSSDASTSAGTRSTAAASTSSTNNNNNNHDT